jgi:integrase
MAHLPWHSLRHRFARWMIDRFGLDAGELMAVGGWENIATVENRYYKSSQEHEESALDRVERG